ncbi:adult-specific rigid cuticular protein 15.5-like [Anastrepha obliqua]|uniref:adult-specific rigid cuticular protein 15.5-like n=1 Tax=Anastrepha obliqua TaxID=95512 RepID=UPI00240A3F53|nr:adult-specific rigid cuticular protein 15.5-like [Anastrepha obliqua]
MKLAMFTSIFGVLVTVSCVIASTNAVAYIASPLLRAYPYVYSAHSSSLVTPTQQQYHTQDGLGQYAYGYAEPHSAKQEVRSLDGITRGSYSYRDAAGKLQTVDYTADDNGFRVAATNLPRAVAVEQSQKLEQQQPFRAAETSGGVPFTADVATARDVHAAAHRETLLRLSAGGKPSGESATAGSDTGSVQLPQPVDDTVAVAAAKADHFRRHEQERELHEILQQGRAITPTTIVPTAISASVIPSIYNYGYPWRYYYY